MFFYQKRRVFVDKRASFEILFWILPLFIFALPNFKHMYAIVEIAGQQFKAESQRKYTFIGLWRRRRCCIVYRVLLTEDGGTVKIGTPTVVGVKVNAKIVGHMKDDKVTIYKKKRRKTYEKTQGRPPEPYSNSN